jgi:hypothetical protein
MSTKGRRSESAQKGHNILEVEMTTPDGDDDQIRHNLTTAASSPHWRNTWLFAAGRLYTGGDYHRRLVLEIIASCDQRGHWPGWLYQIAPELAADMLDDGMAVTRPNDQRQLVELALRNLDGPVPENPVAIVRGLSAAARNDVEQRLKIREVLGEAANAVGVRQSVAVNLLTPGESFGSHIPGVSLYDLRRHVDMWRYKAPTGSKVTVGQLLREAFADAGAGDDFPSRQIVEAAMRECDDLVLRRTTFGDLWPESSGKQFECPALYAALDDPEGKLMLEIALGAMQPEDWAGRSLLARAYWSAASRRPVGARLS